MPSFKLKCSVSFNFKFCILPFITIKREMLLHFFQNYILKIEFFFYFISKHILSRSVPKLNYKMLYFIGIGRKNIKMELKMNYPQKNQILLRTDNQNVLELLFINKITYSFSHLVHVYLSKILTFRFESKHDLSNK